MSDHALDELRSLLRQLASNLDELDNTVYRNQDDARTELMLTARMLDAFNTATFGLEE